MRIVLFSMAHLPTQISISIGPLRCFENKLFVLFKIGFRYALKITILSALAESAKTF
jgi:hypothetical protein